MPAKPAGSHRLEACAALIVVVCAGLCAVAVGQWAGRLEARLSMDGVTGGVVTLADRL